MANTKESFLAMLEEEKACEKAVAFVKKCKTMEDV